MFLYFNEYLKATRNEEEIDKLFYRKCGFSPSSFGYIPRPLIWLSTYKKYKTMVFIFSLLTKVFLFFGGWFFLFFMELIKSWSIFKNKFDGGNINFDCLVMAFSERAYDIIKKNESLVAGDYVWMHFPWNKKPNEGSHINCYNLISKWEAIRILFGSLFLTYYYVLTKRGSWILQFYTMYRWMLVRHALSKVRAEIYVCTDHFDRWAILLDSALKEKNEKGMSFRYILIQHGILKQLSEDGRSYINNFEFNLPSRLCMVTDIYAYDLDSIRVFKYEIISGCILGKVNFNLMSMGFSLVDVEQDFYHHEMNNSILFVGHPLCFEQQLEIYKKISSFAIVYYKPHPTIAPSNTMLKVGWKIIEDKDYFPKVDFLVSYPSTLVVEYQTQGIDSVVHPLNANAADIDLCIISILERIGQYELTK